MTTTKNIYPIRRSLLLMITGITAAIIIAVIIFISINYIDETKKQIEKNTRHWTEIIAKYSIKALENDTHEQLKNDLAVLSKIPYINYVHIYRKQADSDSPVFFSSYNRNNNYPAIADKINELEQLFTPRYSQNFIEFIAPINVNNQIVGYIYIQSSLEQIDNLTRKILIISVITITLAILVLLLVVSRLERLITAPIYSITETILQVSKQKDYSIRCDKMQYKDADILARNINIMLGRIEKHLIKQDNAEQQILKLNHELEDKVNKRTEALKDSNQELLSTLEKLHQFQGQLVESEKMASLGDMVAGVAHEVNTPIGLGVTASTLLSDRLNEIKVDFENKTLKSSQLKRFLNEGQENVGIIYRNLNRAADLISSFKKVAVDQSNENTRLFNVKELLQEVLLTLAPQLKKTPYVIDIDCPDELTVTTKPGPINQILINLILNSVIHGFENRSQGQINITIMQLSGQLNINYRDNGKGIEQSIRAKVFDPFITTKRGEGGSGLGLHLVYNLVTQALGGTINLESEPDEGVIFDINFPIN